MERRDPDSTRDTRTLRTMFPATAQHPTSAPHTTGAPHSISAPRPTRSPRPTDMPRTAPRSPSASLPTNRLPVPVEPRWRASHDADWETSAPTVIVPAPSRTVMRLPTAAPARIPVSRWPRIVMFAAVLVSAVVAFGLHVVQAQQQHAPVTASVPAPSGRGPWTATDGAVVYIAPAPVSQTSQQKTQSAATGAGGGSIPAALQPCHDATMFLPVITQWSVPPGCYANIYVPNPANYVQRPGFGWCNWWVRVTHPNHPDITENLSYPRNGTPVAGAPIFFDGNEQGASSEGHWAVAVAVAPDHYWVLISEMNFAWRGAGWGKIDYRYIHVSPYVHFVDIFS